MSHDHEPVRRTGQEPDVAVLGVVAVPELDAWSVRVTVPHVEGAVAGWAPFVFWTGGAARTWLDARRTRQVRPGVRDCGHGPNELAYAVVVDDDGAELLVSEPMGRSKAAAVAAMFAAEFRMPRAA